MRLYFVTLLILVAFECAGAFPHASAADIRPSASDTWAENPAARPSAAEPDQKSPKPASALSAGNIEEYYGRASNAEEPALPDGLRVTRWGHSGSRAKAPPVITSQCLRFAPGEFSGLFLHSPYTRRLRELFVEQGSDAGKITNLLVAHSARGNEIVSIFDDGYMMLFDQDEKATYVFPIGKDMGERLFNLIR